MKLSTGILLHVLALAIQYGNLALGIVPPKAQGVVALVVGLAQAVLGYFQHITPSPVPAVAK